MTWIWVMISVLALACLYDLARAAYRTTNAILAASDVLANRIEQMHEHLHEELHAIRVALDEANRRLEATDLSDLL